MSSSILPLFAGRFFFSLFWNVVFCLYCLILFRYLFSLSAYTSNFWFISSCYIVWYNSCVCFFFFLSQHIPAFLFSLIIFACCRFRISVSSLIPHPRFEFLFVFFRGTQISSQISPFNSVMMFVEICVNNSFIFQFLPWLFSSFCFLAMTIKSSFQT